MAEEETTEKITAIEYSGPTEFVHLHNHTLFSTLDGIAAPEDYFRVCAERKWEAVAITEHGVMSSIPDAYLASKEYNVKFIAGCEIYFNDYELERQKLLTEKGLKWNELKENDVEKYMRLRRNRHLTVICKNEDGYKSLLALNKTAYEIGMFYKPRIWFDQLKKHKEGLIILSGCLNGPVCHELRRNKHFRTTDGVKGAKDYVEDFLEVFGEDYYIELQMPGIPGDPEKGILSDIEVFEGLVEIADEYKIKTVITNDAHYLERRDFELQKIMMAADQGLKIDDPTLFHVNSSEQFFKSRAELRKTFINNGYNKNVGVGVFEKSCENSLEVASKCKSFNPDLEPKLPTIENAAEKLIREAYKGLKAKGLDKIDTKFHTMDGNYHTYKEQMKLELQRFIDKGYDSYFLITQDLVQCSLRQGKPIGPARGSAGGSLVCYLLDIHSLDPMRWGLSFDRFLSPARGGTVIKVTMD